MDSSEKGEARVTTRSGDEGYTSLLGPDRVPKSSLRVSAFGTLDEATSSLGLARALCADDGARTKIRQLQDGLYRLMAELATPATLHEKAPFKVGSEQVEQLERVSEELKKQVRIGKDFIVPGDTPCGAALDVARTIIRRGERLTARLVHEGEVDNPHVLEWLNRLSDVVFILARYVEAAARTDAEG